MDSHFRPVHTQRMTESHHFTTTAHNTAQHKSDIKIQHNNTTAQQNKTKQHTTSHHKQVFTSVQCHHLPAAGGWGAAHRCAAVSCTPTGGGGWCRSDAALCTAHRRLHVRVGRGRRSGEEQNTAQHSTAQRWSAFTHNNTAQHNTQQHKQLPPTLITSHHITSHHITY